MFGAPNSGARVEGGTRFGPLFKFCTAQLGYRRQSPRESSWPSTNKAGRGALFIPGSDKIFLWIARLCSLVLDPQRLQQLGVNHSGDWQPLRRLERSNRLTTAGANFSVYRPVVITPLCKSRLH
jgi:hypothetical protein